MRDDHGAAMIHSLQYRRATAAAVQATRKRSLGQLSPADEGAARQRQKTALDAYIASAPTHGKTASEEAHEGELGCFGRTPNEGMVVARLWRGERLSSSRTVVKHAGGLHRLIDEPLSPSAGVRCRRGSGSVTNCPCDACKLLTVAGLQRDCALWAMPMRVCYPVTNRRALLALGCELVERGIVSTDLVFPTVADVEEIVLQTVQLHRARLVAF